MNAKRHSLTRKALFWALLLSAIGIPLVAAGMSPLLAWRQPIYVISGFAGIFALALLLVQPLLIGDHVPGLTTRRARSIHRVVGALLVVSVLIHVGGLWITSPPDVVDALLFRSPTPFSNWGVVAMWAVFGAALLAALRTRIGLPLPTWRVAHTGLAVVIVVGAVVHTLLIEGTMELISKIALCAAVIMVSAIVFRNRRSWAVFQRKR